MSKLKILYVPDHRLNLKSEDVDFNDKDLKKNIEDMKETLGVSNGIGLAAPQVGILKRLVIIDMRNAEDIDENHIVKDEERVSFVMINPRIKEKSDECVKMQEGCLSVPGVFIPVLRPREIIVEYYDENFDLKTLSASGLTAKCIQHEIDHLNGVVMIDYASLLKKEIAIKKVKKIVSHK